MRAMSKRRLYQAVLFVAVVLSPLPGLAQTAAIPLLNALTSKSGSSSPANVVKPPQTQEQILAALDTQQQEMQKRLDEIKAEIVKSQNALTELASTDVAALATIDEARRIINQDLPRLQGDLAEHASATFGKGVRVILEGRLDFQTWETDDGDKRSAVKIIVEDIGPSVKWATAVVSRTEKTAQPSSVAPSGRRWPVRTGSVPLPPQRSRRLSPVGRFRRAASIIKAPSFAFPASSRSQKAARPLQHGMCLSDGMLN